VHRVAVLTCLSVLTVLTGCGGSDDGGLYDDSVDWSSQCGTLRVIANDDDQGSANQARALDLLSQYC
jgi:hypothetical protein